MPSPDWKGVSCCSRRRTVHPEQSAMSRLIGTFNDGAEDLLDSIPEHDWRLLAALARKREMDDETELLADQFRKMWLKEKQEREKAEAETLAEYKHYLNKKRQQERSLQEFRQLQKTLEQHVRKSEILDCIKHKAERSAVLLAHIDDQKATEMVDKALEERARALMAADRRSRLGVAQECRRMLDLADGERRAHRASKKRNAILRDASQRAAISNALRSWESAMVRREVRALDRARRAMHGAHAALAAERGARREHATQARRARARALAALTAHMRDAVRAGTMCTDY